MSPIAWQSLTMYGDRTELLIFSPARAKETEKRRRFCLRFLIYPTCVFKCSTMLLARQAPDTCCLFLNIRKVAKKKKECCAVFSFLFLSAVPGLSEPQPCEKRLSHQLFLRLSRACLGKLSVLSMKVAQKGVFLCLSRACLGKMIVF
jgi:hypothetical protein